MQVSVEQFGDLGRRLKVVVPSDRYAQGVHARIRELSKTVALHGFRRGKVPAMVIEKRFGQQVRDEIGNEIVRETLSQAIAQENLRPAVTPQVQVEAIDPEFAYTATFEVMPEFGDIDVSELEIARETAQITDADIDRMIDNLRRQRMSLKPVERGAAAGDYVSFEFVVDAGDVRVPAEGMERGLTVIGQNAVLPEIEKALEGLAAEQTATLEVEFPADYREAQLAGKRARVEVKVLRVSEVAMPEVDDAFAASFNVQGGVEQFRQEVRANLERELTQALAMRLRTQVAEKLVARFDSIKVPEGLVAQDMEGLRRQFIAEANERARRAGQPTPPEPALESFRETARRRVLVGLLLAELAGRNQIRLDGERVRSALAAIASTYEDPSEVIALYQQNERLMDGLRSRVMDEQVAEWVADHAKTTLVERSFQDVLTPSAAA
jgi:trigger factor